MTAPLDNNFFKRTREQALSQFDLPDRQIGGKVEEFTRGAVEGIGNTVGDIASLPGLVLPGNDPFEQLGDTIRTTVSDVTDARGTAGRVGKFTGSVFGEGLSVLAGS